ncbi:hypothetical protein OA165_03240 [Prochlorococcus sp. AH-736-A21]|nr:hypothetical protein [Prochlorococcus sp. AH-736-A21]
MVLKKIKKFFQIKKSKISNDIYFQKRRINSLVFACYDFELIIKQVVQYFKTKQISRIILGTIRFNFDAVKEYPEIPSSHIEEYEYLSFYWVQISNRYLRRQFNIDKSDLVSIFDKSQVYLNARYLISLVELSIKASYKNNFVFISPSTGNRIVDKLFKKYYKKKYSLNIKFSYFSQIIKPLNDIYFLYKKLRLNKSCLIRPFLIGKSIYSNNKTNKIFIHHKLIQDFEPYNFLLKDLSKQNDFVSLNFISFIKIGSQNKIQFFYELAKFTVRFLKNNFLILISHSLYFESIQLLSNYIYYLCCTKTIKKLNIKTIVLTYIDFDYENILYKACRDENAVSIVYDYSMGYPIVKSFIGRSQADIDRSPNYLVTCGLQRCNQYNYANKYKNSMSKTITINSISPLIEYAQKVPKTKINLHEKCNSKYYLSKGLKISIFDNIYAYNFYINEKDILSCIDSLKKSSLDKVILCHSKKGFLKSHLLRSGMNYLIQQKGNFSKVFFSDFIISIGLQGAAIKSAFAFKKPLIFYTENSIHFEDANFYLNEEENQKVRYLIENLTFNSYALSRALSNESTYRDFYLKIRENSSKLLKIFMLNEDLDGASKVISNLIQ